MKLWRTCVFRRGNRDPVPQIGVAPDAHHRGPEKCRDGVNREDGGLCEAHGFSLGGGFHSDTVGRSCGDGTAVTKTDMDGCSKPPN